MPAADHLYTLMSVVTQAAGDNFVETYLGTIIQTAVILFGVGVAYGALRAGMNSHDLRLGRVEEAIEEMGKMTVLLTRLEERYNAMDQRVLAHGQRMDAHQTTTANIISSQATLIGGRLDAINSIVAGHTAQLDRLRPPPTRRE